MIHNGYPCFVTLEDPFNSNKPFESCIPKGTYQCSGVYSPKFGSTYLVEGVSARTEILFHIGNSIKDTQGCILLGSSFGELAGVPAILESKKALTAFLDRLKGHGVFTLIIEDA